jgi:hypothetical protein
MSWQNHQAVNPVPIKCANKLLLLIVFFCFAEAANMHQTLHAGGKPSISIWPSGPAEMIQMTSLKRTGQAH